jgi:hypothetical protein
MINNDQMGNGLDIEVGVDSYEKGRTVQTPKIEV